jgi:hypothetical protein
MTKPHNPGPIWPLAAIGLLVLATVATDLVVLRPRRAAIRRLEAEAAKLDREIEIKLGDRNEIASLSTALGGKRVDAYLADYRRQGSLPYLNSLLSKFGGSRTDFQNEGGTDEGPFTVVTYFVRLRGSYSEIRSLIREIEKGERLVKLRDFQIDRNVQEEGTGLEARFRLSVYGMKGNE